MNNYILVGEGQLGETVVTKLHSVGDLNCIGVLHNNQLETIVFKGNSYIPPILPEEISGMADAGFLVNDNFTTEGSEG